MKLGTAALLTIALSTPSLGSITAFTNRYVTVGGIPNVWVAYPWNSGRWDPRLPAQSQGLADPDYSFGRSGVADRPRGNDGSVASYDFLTMPAGMTFVTGTSRYGTYELANGVVMDLPPLPSSMPSGSIVGPGLNYQHAGTIGSFFNPGPFTGLPTSQSFSWSGTTGFKMDLPDGPHYGYVIWTRLPSQGRLGGYVDLVPLHWAYETDPNRPITIPTPTATLGVIALPGAAAWRRKRRR